MHAIERYLEEKGENTLSEVIRTAREAWKKV